jgi:hypothetical protein
MQLEKMDKTIQGSPGGHAKVSDTIFRRFQKDGGDSCYATDPAAFLYINMLRNNYE